MSSPGTAKAPPDAVWRACFGLPAGDEAFARACGPLDETLTAITAAAAATGLRLPRYAPREGCRLADDLGSDAAALRDMLMTSSDLARLDRAAAGAFADDGGFVVEPAHVKRVTVSIGSAGRSRIVREICAVRAGWELPAAAALTIISDPGQKLCRAEAEFMPGARIYEAALKAADRGRYSEFPFEHVIGPDPEGFELRTRAAASRPRDSVFRRSAAAWLCARIEEAVLDLPPGRSARDASVSPSRWSYAAADAAAVGAAIARLSGPGPGHACTRLSLSGPFADGDPFIIDFASAGEDDSRTLAAFAETAP